MKRTAVLVSLFLGVALGHAQTWQAIDASASTVTVKAYKTGLFSGFAHDHVIRGPIAQGRVALDREAVEIEIQAARLQVLDPQLGPDKRAEIQTRMLGPEVLHVESFPAISFRSETVKKTGDNAWLVTGPLALHGQSRPVEVKVTREGNAFRGAATIRQRDFGIKPVSIAGGTVKVKDEVTIEFEVRLANPAQAASR